MTKEKVIKENSNTVVLFRGTIKSLRLKTTPCYFCLPPEPIAELEQRLTITAKGRVRVSRKFGSVLNSDEKPETVTQKLVISVADAEKIFDSINRYFAKEHEKYMVTDVGTWDLKLTNTEGEVFLFSGFTCFPDRGSELIRVSKLIRKITGLGCIMGFDEDSETVLTPEEQERMKYLETCGIYTEEELNEIKMGLIKNIRIEEDENTGDKHICYCFDNGGVYRDICLGTTPNGGDYADAYYYDEKEKLTSRENAFCIDIHEMRFDGKMVGTVWGLCERGKD